MWIDPYTTRHREMERNPRAWFRLQQSRYNRHRQVHYHGRHHTLHSVLVIYLADMTNVTFVLKIRHFMTIQFKYDPTLQYVCGLFDRLTSFRLVIFFCMQTNWQYAFSFYDIEYYIAQEACFSLTSSKYMSPCCLVSKPACVRNFF